MQTNWIPDAGVDDDAEHYSVIEHKSDFLKSNNLIGIIRVPERICPQQRALIDRLSRINPTTDCTYTQITSITVVFLLNDDCDAHSLDACFRSTAYEAQYRDETISGMAQTVGSGLVTRI